MKVGDLVVVLGGFDNRVRDHKQETLVIGTLEQLLIENQASVILENNDIWVGEMRHLAKAKEQEFDEEEEKDERE